LSTQKVQKREANDQEDENLQFFKSLLLHIKKVQSERILAFRGRIQGLVQEFAYSTNSFSFQTLHSPHSSTAPAIQTVPMDSDYTYL
jgi:hypothetical protein